MVCVCQAPRFVNRFAGPSPPPIDVRILGHSSVRLTDCRYFVNMHEIHSLQPNLSQKDIA